VVGLRGFLTGGYVRSESLCFDCQLYYILDWESAQDVKGDIDLDLISERLYANNSRPKMSFDLSQNEKTRSARKYSGEWYPR
jgi:hypothetical protein